jgi:hypothetical protein
MEAAAVDGWKGTGRDIGIWVMRVGQWTVELERYLRYLLLVKGGVELSYRSMLFLAS